MSTPRDSGSGSGPGTLRCPECNAVYTPPLENCPSCGLELPQPDFLIEAGSIIDDKYEVIRLLGAGGMGEVYKARHVHLNAIRTIKVLRPGLLADSWIRARFLREARLATQLSHANLAVVHDFSILANGGCFMISEFIDGLTIRQWIRRFGRFPLPLAVEVSLQVLSGLAYCHRRGLLHRDISPDNVMITVDPDDLPVVKIIDLGIAKQLAGRSADATQTGQFVGNPKYCSPEHLGQLEAGEDIDGRADIYSLGLVLYEMVAGSAPFQSTTPQGYMIKHLTQPPPALPETGEDDSIPAEFQAVVFKALEKQREARYASAEDFALALRPFREDISGGLEEKFGIRLADEESADSSPDEREHSTKTARRPSESESTEESESEYPKTRENRLEAEERAKREEAAREEQRRQEEARDREREDARRLVETRERERESRLQAEQEAARARDEEQERHQGELRAQRQENERRAKEVAAREREEKGRAEIAAVEARERERVAVREAPRERERPPMQAPKPPPQPLPRRGRAAAVAVAAAALALSAWFIVSRTRVPAVKTTQPSRAAGPILAPPPPATGLLAVDALPWGRVESVRDRAGKDWLKVPSYTPLALRLPPGRYSILVISANYPGQTLRLDADVVSAQTASLRGQFEILDADTYFVTSGWSR